MYYWFAQTLIFQIMQQFHSSILAVPNFPLFVVFVFVVAVGVLVVGLVQVLIADGDEVGLHLEQLIREVARGNCLTRWQRTAEPLQASMSVWQLWHSTSSWHKFFSFFLTQFHTFFSVLNKSILCFFERFSIIPFSMPMIRLFSYIF